MSKRVQHRRGTTAQHSSFTGATGEITVDTDKKTAVVHDGATAGGMPLARTVTTTRGDQIRRGASADERVAIGTAAQLWRSDGTDPGWSDDIVQKSVTVTNPSASENIPLWVARKNYTVERIDCYLVGSSTPSCTFKLWKGSDPTSGTAVVTAGTTVTATTSVTTVTSFDSATVASGDAFWLTTTAVSGTVLALHVTVHYKRTSV